jgi:hypothetical protein
MATAASGTQRWLCLDQHVTPRGLRPCTAEGLAHTVVHAVKGVGDLRSRACILKKGNSSFRATSGSPEPVVPCLVLHVSEVQVWWPGGTGFIPHENPETGSDSSQGHMVVGGGTWLNAGPWASETGFFLPSRVGWGPSLRSITLSSRAWQTSAT